MVRPITRLPSEFAVQQLQRCEDAVKALESILSENEMELLNDALHCFANHPDWWGCDEEFDESLIFASCFDRAGYNHIKDEYNRLLDCGIPGLDG